MALRGRCRYCRAPISARYPFVEALTCAVFLLHWPVFGEEPLLLVVRLAFACANSWRQLAELFESKFGEE